MDVSPPPAVPRPWLEWLRHHPGPPDENKITFTTPKALWHIRRPLSKSRSLAREQSPVAIHAMDRQQATFAEQLQQFAIPRKEGRIVIRLPPPVLKPTADGAVPVPKHRHVRRSRPRHIIQLRLNIFQQLVEEMGLGGPRRGQVHSKHVEGCRARLLHLGYDHPFRVLV